MSSDAPLRSGRLQRDYVISQACVKLAGFLQRARDQNDEPMEATYRDLQTKWWEKARVSFDRYHHEHQNDVRLWPQFFENQTGISALDIELVCHHIFLNEMDAIRGDTEKKKRFDRVATLLRKGSYYLFVLLGPAVCASVASMKKIAATLSSSSPDQIIDQIWVICLERHGINANSPPAPSVGDVTRAVSLLRPEGPSSRATSHAPSVVGSATPGPAESAIMSAVSLGKRVASSIPETPVDRAAKRPRHSRSEDEDDEDTIEPGRCQSGSGSGRGSMFSPLADAEQEECVAGERAEGRKDVERERADLLRRIAALPPMPGYESLWGGFADMAGSFADLLG